MALVAFNDRFPDRDLVAHAFRCPSSTGDLTPPAAGVDLSVSAVARVDQGRWIADCPFGCGGAEFVSLSGLPFFCTECRNTTTGNVPITVSVPDAKTCAQIDAYLTARPVPGNRNWHPNESVKQLRDENREHGIRLP